MMLFDYQFKNYNFRLALYVLLLNLLGVYVIRSATNQDIGLRWEADHGNCGWIYHCSHSVAD